MPSIGTGRGPRADFSSYCRQGWIGVKSPRNSCSLSPALAAEQPMSPNLLTRFNYEWTEERWILYKLLQSWHSAVEMQNIVYNGSIASISTDIRVLMWSSHRIWCPQLLQIWLWLMVPFSALYILYSLVTLNHTSNWNACSSIFLLWTKQTSAELSYRIRKDDVYFITTETEIMTCSADGWTLPHMSTEILNLTSK